MEQYRVVITKEYSINHGGMASRNGQAPIDDRGQWAVVTADASIGVPQRRLGVKDLRVLVRKVLGITPRPVSVLIQCSTFQPFG